VTQPVRLHGQQQGELAQGRRLTQRSDSVQAGAHAAQRESGDRSRATSTSSSRRCRARRTPAEVQYSTLPSPTVNPPTSYDPSITGPGDPLIDHVISIVGNTLSAFFSNIDVAQYQLTQTH
jgi:hypothetical protein